MTPDLDRLAASVHELVTETAAHQISREIAHLAVIDVDHHTPTLEPPVGYRAPAPGVITTHVVARSRDVPSASVETRIAAWIDDDSDTVRITRADSDRVLDVSAAELTPEPSDGVRARVNDFVAVIIAHMVSSLNVAMQRSYVGESSADVAEYENG